MKNHELVEVAEPDVCCPPFDPSIWQHKKHIWSEKLFLKDSIPELFHIPLPTTYGAAVSRLWKKAADSGAIPDPTEMLLLSHDPSPFKAELLFHVTHVVWGEQHERLSGTFFSKVFDGPYNKIPSFIHEMNGYLSAHRMKSQKYYFYYAYCPKCAQKYGHNYIVAFAQI